MILQIIKDKNKTIYKGFGFTYEEEIITDLLGNEQTLYKTDGGKLVHIVHTPQKDKPLAIKFINIPITYDLIDIFDKEYDNAKKFIEEYQNLIK